MKSCHSAILFIVATTVFLAIDVPNAAQAETHWHCSRSRCCLPKHHYGQDTQRFGGTVFAVANTKVETPSMLMKPFHFRATNLEVDHLKLDRVGLAIHQEKGLVINKDAKLVATGRITHSGGDGGLIGSNVTIRIRAYVAGVADTFQLPPDAIVVWESEHNLWVPRGQKSISLVPESEHLTQPEKLAIYFENITHLEVELEYRRDR